MRQKSHCMAMNLFAVSKSNSSSARRGSAATIPGMRSEAKSDAIRFAPPDPPKYACVAGVTHYLPLFCSSDAARRLVCFGGRSGLFMVIAVSPVVSLLPTFILMPKMTSHWPERIRVEFA